MVVLFQSTSEYHPSSFGASTLSLFRPRCRFSMLSIIIFSLQSELWHLIIIIVLLGILVAWSPFLSLARHWPYSTISFTHSPIFSLLSTHLLSSILCLIILLITGFCYLLSFASLTILSFLDMGFGWLHTGQTIIIVSLWSFP